MFWGLLKPRLVFRESEQANRSSEEGLVKKMTGNGNGLDHERGKVYNSPKTKVEVRQKSKCFPKQVSPFPSQIKIMEGRDRE